MKYVNLNAYSVESMLTAVIDLGYTPLMQVNTYRSTRSCSVPDHLVDANGTITLNISANAVRKFELDKEQGYLSFEATFNRRHVAILVPCEAIVAIFARENTNVACVFNPTLAFMTEEGVIEGMEPIEQPSAEQPAKPVPQKPVKQPANDANKVVQLFKNR